METNILISIRRPWSTLILQGKKTLELRKNKPRPRFNAERPLTLWIYESGSDGTHGIVGKCKLVDWELLPRNPIVDLKLLSEKACVSEEHLKEYSPCFAWKLQDPVRISYPVPLSMIGLSRPPQSWQYLSQPQASILEASFQRPDCSTCANNGELDYYFCNNCTRSPYLVNNYTPITE